MAHSFYAFLAPPIVVGVLLTCQSLDPEYKTTVFFQMNFQEKNIVLYSGQYGISILSLAVISSGNYTVYKMRASGSRY